MGAKDETRNRRRPVAPHIPATSRQQRPFVPKKYAEVRRQLRAFDRIYPFTRPGHNYGKRRACLRRDRRIRSHDESLERLLAGKLPAIHRARVSPRPYFRSAVRCGSRSTSQGSAVFLWDVMGVVSGSSRDGEAGRERWPRAARLRPGYLLLMAIRFTFCCAAGNLGSITVRTPFLKDASTLSGSTSSTGIRRSNRP